MNQIAKGSKAVFELSEPADGVELHVCRIAKFKTLAVRLRLLEPLDERAAARSLLAGVLRRGTRRSPDLMSIARRLEALFGAAAAMDVSRVGEWHASDFTLHVVHGRHLGRSDAFRVALEFLRELITDPAVDGGGFRAREFDQERTNLLRAIDSLKDDKASYAHHRLVETMFAGEPYARHDHGSRDEVGALDRRGLLAYQRQRLERSPAFVYAIGDFSSADLDDLRAFAAAFGGERPREPLPGIVHRDPTATRTTIEEVDAAQSHLFLGYRFDPRSLDRSSQMAFSLLASVLGGGAHSLLFRQVREHAGLAYSTHAGLDRPKGFLSLYAGIHRAALDEALALMRDLVARVTRGECDDATLEAARRALEHSVRTTLDSPVRALDFAARARATGWPTDPEPYLLALAGAGREDVASAAASLREDLCYLASGTCDEADPERNR